MLLNKCEVFKYGASSNHQVIPNIHRICLGRRVADDMLSQLGVNNVHDAMAHKWTLPVFHHHYLLPYPSCAHIWRVFM
jgi:hypothetical protein